MDELKLGIQYLRGALTLVFTSSCGSRLVTWGYMVRVVEGIASGTFHIQEAQTHVEAEAWVGDCLHGLNLPSHCLEIGWGLHAEGHHEAPGITAKQPIGFWSCIEPLLSGQ